MNAQITRVAVLLGFVLLVIMASALSGLMLLRARSTGRPLGNTWLPRLSLSLLALGAACFGYALFIEADWVEVTHVTVQTDKWPAGKKLKLAHLSDFHVDRQSRALSRVTEIVAYEKVDLIVFTGDSLNRAEAAPLFRSILGGLPARLGRVAVRGNHDVAYWSKIDLFGGGIATELMTDAPVLFDEGHLAVCGAPFWGLDGIESCLANAPRESFILFAYHSPDLVEQLAPPPDLYLAGHTHGGQVALPFYGALVTMSAYDKRFESGLSTVGKTAIYVNRGIGFEPHMPRVRFFARPEVTIIEIVGTAR